MNLLHDSHDTISLFIHHIEALSSVLALYLLGSAARNELSVLHHPDGSLEFFSDLEFLLVTDAPLTADQRRALDQALHEAERAVANPNPLFHIDLITRERARLKRFPPIVFTYELKQNAHLLHGDDLRAEIPEVTLANLDLRNTREILYKRLWAILLHLPRRFVEGAPSLAEQRVAGYVLARNALDLTTVLLPHAGTLLPTYRQRVEHLRHHYADFPFAAHFDADFPAFLHTCLDRRLDLDFTATDLYSFYERTLDALECGFRALLPPTVTLDDLPRHSRALYNEWPISRGEWYNLARMSLRQSPIRAVHWLGLPKKGWLTLGLLAMHRALRAHFAGQSDVADDHLARSLDILARLHRTSPIPTGDFPQRWLTARVAWGELWRQYIRLGAPAYRARFQHVMEWTHD
jgi:hypothetical protein